MSTGGPGEIFSVPALFIVFRETLEAAIVCAVLFGVLKKTELTNLNKFVWMGVASGLTFTALVLIAAVVGFNAAADSVLDNIGDELNETEAAAARLEASLRLRMILSFSAAVLIAGMCWTLDGIMKKQQEIENIQKATEGAVGATQSKAITWSTVLFLSGTTVAREGVETVIFLGIGSGFEIKAIPLPLVIGLILGVICGITLYKAGSQLALKWFFRFSVVFLSFVGAGVFAHGFEELFQLKGDELGWWSHIVYNISSCCGLRFEGWGLFRALLGYTPYPTRAELIGYFGYHIVIILGFVVKWQLAKHEVGSKLSACLKKEPKSESNNDDENPKEIKNTDKVDPEISA